MRSPALCLLAFALLPALGCAGPAEAPPPVVDPVEAERIDQINRLSEYLTNTPREDPVLLLNDLERMMISWQTEQRKGREKPLEHLINRKVVANFSSVADAFQGDTHERVLVAAWALGFSRVPENPLGIETRHIEALELIMPALGDAPDDVMRNLTLALWKIGDVNTPLQPVLDLAVNHHDAEVRANATLALMTLLTEQTCATARDTVLVALTDSEPKVRLHAASVAARYPHLKTTRRIQLLLPDESSPLVRASMAKALGSAGERSSAPILVSMLSSNRGIETAYAHAALVAIFGIDYGEDPEEWRRLLPDR